MYCGIKAHSGSAYYVKCSLLSSVFYCICCGYYFFSLKLDFVTVKYHHMYGSMLAPAVAAFKNEKFVGNSSLKGHVGCLAHTA